MKTRILIITVLLLIAHYAKAQDGDQLFMDTLLKATQYTIPSSGAFTLLGVNPEQVSTPGFSRDFKIDYFIEDAKLKPNIAIQCQPFWILFYKNKKIADLNKMNLAGSMLANTSFSFGTTQDLLTGNKFAYSLKTTIGFDPLRDIKYSTNLESILASQAEAISTQTLPLSIDKKGIKDEIKVFRKKIETDSNATESLLIKSR